MLIASLLPLLTRYSLTLDLVTGPDETVTLAIIPRRPEGATGKADPEEVRPISITASAQEIDGELARGADGALGQLIALRKSLGDQLAEQRQAAEDARTTAAAAAKAKPAATPPKPSASTAATAMPASPPADAKAAEPATLW